MLLTIAVIVVIIMLTLYDPFLFVPVEVLIDKLHLMEFAW